MRLAEFQNGENKAIFYLFDDLSGKPPVNIICDAPNVTVKLFKRFAENYPNTSLTTALSPDEVKNAFESVGIMPKNIYTISRCCGKRPKYKLPDGITLKRLCQADIPEIKKVRNRLPEGYARHLTDPADYADLNVLEYGMFKNIALIMTAGCGLSDYSGVLINDSIRFYLTAEKPDNNVFR